MSRQLDDLVLAFLEEFLEFYSGGDVPLRIMLRKSVGLDLIDVFQTQSLGIEKRFENAICTKTKLILLRRDLVQAVYDKI